MTPATDITSGTHRPGADERPLLEALPGRWPYVVTFMLSMSALGLRFYPALLLIALLLAHSWRNSRYDFLIQLMLIIGGYGFIDSSVTYFNLAQVGFALGVLFAFLLRKTVAVKKIVAFIAIYFVIMWGLAIYDDESIRHQWSTINIFTQIIFFTVPLAIFAGRKFDYDKFVRTVFPYALTACVFYILDAFVLSGWVLVPHMQRWGAFTAFYDLAWAPFSGWIVRKYPAGIYILTLLIVPLARQYRIKLWQWVVILIAVLCTQTASYISGLVVIFSLAQGGVVRTLKYFGIGFVALVGLYFVDDSMGRFQEDGVYYSPMRISSTVHQFTDVLDLAQRANADDIEDIADFGSGRVAQIIPAFEYINKMGYQWHGLGFLNNQKTDVPAYTIENELFRDTTQAETSIGAVEVTVLRVYVYSGYIGLIAHILLYVLIYLVVRRMPHSGYFLSVMCAFVWFGIGGFEGLATHMGLTMVGTALAVPLLCARDDQYLEE
ncbi:MAG: hypothetical protein K2M12_01530 [Muribaculaceae bacterium]|nr:hypothetical protein [Muribaculaceae bacterium]